MPSAAARADAVARRLLADARASGGQARDPVAAAERAAEDLAHALAGWFGPYGTYALFTRALAQTRPDHRALDEVRLRAPLTPVLDGLAAAAQVHGAPAMCDAVVAVLAAAVGLLGRMIGEDMALHLVERRMEGFAPIAPDHSPTQDPGHPPAITDGSTNRSTAGGGA